MLTLPRCPTPSCPAPPSSQDLNTKQHSKSEVVVYGNRTFTAAYHVSPGGVGGASERAKSKESVEEWPVAMKDMLTPTHDFSSAAHHLSRWYAWRSSSLTPHPHSSHSPHILTPHTHPTSSLLTFTPHPHSSHSSHTVTPHTHPTPSLLTCMPHPHSSSSLLTSSSHPHTSYAPSVMHGLTGLKDSCTSANII